VDVADQRDRRLMSQESSMFEILRANNGETLCHSEVYTT
jgi:hypothetical protein